MLKRFKGHELHAITLAEGGKVPDAVQVLRVGKFKHPSYGDFEITKQTLSEMKTNFDKRVRGVDICFDYFHKSDEEAAGWPSKLELREDGQSLWATGVDWTPKATQKLAEREIRYFSPDFAFKWTDPETNTVYKNVLFGGGLTNRPFVKEMESIVASEIETENPNKGDKKMSDAEKLAELQKKFDDLQAQLTALKNANETMLGENKGLKDANEKMLAEKKVAEEAKVLAEKTSEFQVLLTEGKACAAQKDAFLKGDMTEFIKLAEKPNLEGTGSSESREQTSDSDEDKILKLAETKRASDKNLDYVESISLARKEIKAKAKAK